MRVRDRVHPGRGPASRTAVFGLVGVALLVGSGSLTGATPRAQGSPAAPTAPGAGDPPGVLVVSAPASLPDAPASGVAGLAEVSAAVPVVSATVWMTRSDNAAGTAVDTLPTGEGIPLDLRAADLAGYASLTSPGVRTSFTGLAPDEVLLGATSAQLRRLGPGATLTVGGTRLRVAGVVPDADVGFAEVFTSVATAARLGVSTVHYLLVQPKAGVNSEQLTQLIRGLPGSVAKLGIAGPSQSLGKDVSVLPQVLEKQDFGEFAVRLPAGKGGWLSLDPGWSGTHLRTVSVPILGRVTCNAAILPALRSALGEVAKAGLASLVSQRGYGGCFAARFVAGATTDAISHHAWGSAIDLNVAANPLGGPSHQDPRLVEIFRRWGFTWGGDWLSPDPMHFELREPAVGTTPVG